MLAVVLGLACCSSIVSGLIPPSNVCYRDLYPKNACIYGNLTVAVLGKTFKPNDCGSQVDVRDFDRAPFIYINSTNSTERFTVLIQDLGYSVPGGVKPPPVHLQWMVTNVSINTLPDYTRIPPNNILTAYEKPLLMHGLPQPHLLQILVFRHANVLRVPFGELWVTRKHDFSIGTLFSNISPILQLCGPVAGAQYWVHDATGSSHFPSVPQPPQPGAPIFIPVVPVQPGYVPAQSQPGNFPAQGQPGHIPVGSAPGQPGYNPHPHQPHMTNTPKKSSAVTITLPFGLLCFYLGLVVLAV